MINCIAIDDEPLALKQMASYIEKAPDLHLLETFSSAIKAFSYLQEHKVDLMFVDINMPDLSGIDFVKSLTNPPRFIFTTAYQQYAVEGFRVDASDYLVKPISFSDFISSVNRVRTRFFEEKNDSIEASTSEEFLFVKSEYKLIRINFDEIKYIESMRDYVRIHLDNQKPIMTLLSMNKLWDKLSHSKFIRVHRSYIVNRNKITTIERNRIIFDAEVYIPVSDQYKSDFQKFLDDFMIK